MSTTKSWLARVSMCVAVAAPALVAAPAFANGKYTERLYTTADGAVFKVRQPEGAEMSEEAIQRAVATRAAEVQAERAAAPAEAEPAAKKSSAAAGESHTTVSTKSAASAISAKPDAAGANVDGRDLSCLTEALYYEARGEGVQGQKAVAEVILNRVDHPRFPKSVCGVVNQSGQFSYHGRVSKRFNERGAYQQAKTIARAALLGAPRNLTNGATYFHTGGVRPSWSRKFLRTTRIGSHIFYRSGGGQRLASN